MLKSDLEGKIKKERDHKNKEKSFMNNRVIINGECSS